MQLVNLRAEYMVNPLGLDVLAPQFSWEIETDNERTHQQSLIIKVALSPGYLAGDSNLLWNSGVVHSLKSSGIRYAGPALESRQRYYWTVEARCGNDETVTPHAPAFFEMGLLHVSDWQALWIGCPSSWTGRVLYFRRAFSLSKEVKSARVYISGLGYYVFHLNGKKVGDHVLDPATSDYNKQVFYMTYDISDLLEKQNAFGIMVGPGWYGVPKLRMQAEILYADGTSETIATCWDPYSNWLVSTGGTISSSIFDGEIYDAREEKPGWSLPEMPEEKWPRTQQWINAVVTDSPGGKMVAQKIEPIKVVNTVTPRLIGEPARGVYVFDTRQNGAGWASIKVEGESGTKIVLKFSESLNADGTVNQENLRSAAAQDIYILKGGDLEAWEPSFTYHGFRYIQVEGFPYAPKDDSIQVKIVRSAVSSSGTFECSNHLLNRIHKMVVATEASNLHSIPTDCPQRDERMGWLNDMTVRIEQALYNFDLARFYAKWLDDVADTQHIDGTITDTAPFRWGFRPADPVSASYLIAALKSYRFYGNDNIIRDHYTGMKAWTDFLASKTDDGILNYSYWGDWSPPEAFGTPGSVGSGAVSKYTPGLLISTGYLFYCQKMTAQMAEIIGNNEDAVLYQKLSLQTATAFNRAFFNKQSGGYGSNNQACNCFALFLGVVEHQNITHVVNNLVADVKKHDYHLTTGNLCTKYLLEMLTEHGHVDVAYNIATQETYPGWGFMLASGATTLWERWENKTSGEMNSHNHPMMGSVGSWFYKYLGGIMPDHDSSGFNKFTIKPYIPSSLDRAETSFRSVKGLIRSRWEKQNGSLFLQVTIPPNSLATVYIPSKDHSQITLDNKPIGAVDGIKMVGQQNSYTICELGSGNYEFKAIW